jgi:hypothetical protein
VTARRTVLAGLLLALAGGCSMTPEGDPLRPRFFTAEGEVAATSTAHGDGPWLRLGRVRAAEHLGFRFAWRDGRVYGHFERRRWNESPVVYLERALVRCLFHQAGLRRAVVAGHPTLEATLLGFEELRHEGKPPRASAVVGYALLRGDQLLAEGTIAVEVPVATPAEADDDDAPGLVIALEEALRQAVDRVAREVRPSLPAN